MAEEKHRLEIEIETTGNDQKIDEVKRKIDSLHDKTVTINVVTKHSGGSGDAAKGLESHAAASRNAADAAQNLGRASNSAASGLSSHASAADAATRSTRGLGDESARAAAMQRGWARASEEVNSASQRAAAATRDVAAATEQGASAAQKMSGAGAPMRQFAVDAGGATRAISAVASTVEGAETVMASTAREAVAVGHGFEIVGRGASGASGGFREVGGEASHAGAAISSAGGELERAGGGFDSFIARSYNAAGGLERVSAGIRRVGSAAGGGAPPIDIFGKVMSDASGDAEKVAKSTNGAAMSTRSLGMAAIGAGVAWLGMAALTAGTAAIGGAGAFLGMRQAPQLMHAAQQGVKGFNDEFKKTRQAMTDAGAPAMAGLAASAKALGAELAHVGVDNIGTMLAGASSIVGQTTSAINKLEPAIKPATGAVVAGVNAVIGAVGNSGPAITSFASSIMQNAPGIQSALESVVNVASIGGQALNSFVGAAGPMLKEASSIASFATDLGSGNAANLGFLGMPNVSVPGFSGAVSSLSGGLPSGVRNVLSQFVGSGMGMPMLAPTLQPLAAAIRGGAAGQGVFGATSTETPSAPGVRPVASAGRPAGQAYEAGAFPGYSYQNHVDDAGNVVSDMFGANAQAGNGVPSQGKLPPPAPTAQQQAATTAAPSTAPPGINPQNPGALGFGSGTRPMPASATAQINEAKTAYQQLGSTAQQSMQQVNQASTTGGQGVQQHMQQATQAVSQAAPAMQAAASKIPQSIAQGANSQPGAVSGAVHQQVSQASSGAAPAANAAGGNVGASMAGGMGKSITKSETDTLTIAKRWATRVSSGAAPAAAEGGSDAGSAMGGGMGKGITKTETDTLTIVKRWVTRIVDAGKDALGIASPSKVFTEMGMNVAAGMAVGITSGSPAAVTASSQMATGVVQGATTSLGGSSAGPQMANSIGTHLASAGTQYGQQFAGNFAAQAGGFTGGRAPNLAAIAPRGGDGAYLGATPPGGQVPPGQITPGQGGNGQQLTPEEQAARANQPGRMPGLDANGNPITPDKAIEMGLYPAGSQADFRARALGRTTQEPTNYVLRAQAHHDRAAELKAQRDQRHADALSAARQGITPNEATAQRIAQEQQQAIQQHQQQSMTSQDRISQQSVDPFRTTPPPPPSQTLQQSINDHLFNSQQTIEQTKQKGQALGQALGQGAAQGVQQSQDQAAQAVVALGKGQQDAYKKEHGIASPSTVFAQLSSEIGAGMSQGLASASDSIQGVASDRGLQVGYTYGRSFVTGADSVIQKDLFQGISRPQIDSPQAMAALGAAGLLGPAGSGAQIPKSRTVTLSPGSGSSGTPQINATVLVTVDGAGPMRVIASEVVDVAMDHLGDAIGLQRTA